jgi:hypothetical protein
MKLNLWLDGFRRAPTFIESGLVWTTARTGDEAIEMLRSGNVEFTLLECDPSGGFKDKTSLDVMTWMTENTGKFSVFPNFSAKIWAGSLRHSKVHSLGWGVNALLSQNRPRLDGVSLPPESQKRRTPVGAVP